MVAALRRSAAIVGVAGIGWVDFVTGPSLSLGPLYLLPVILVAWYDGRTWAFFVMSAATAAWFFADVPYRSVVGVPIWNATTRLLTFATVAWVVARLRGTESRVRHANARLAALLDSEKVVARTDELTGLLNRRGFYDHCRVELARARRAGTPTGLIYLDLDNFKAANDRHGHEIGDSVLATVGATISACVRETDVCGRLGGDEFAVFCWKPTRAILVATARRIEERVEEAIGGWKVGASTGVAWCDAAHDDFDRILREAGAQMYSEKRTKSRPSGQLSASSDGLSPSAGSRMTRARA